MILAFGCSVTHGAELVHANQHEDNVKYSYPNLVANTLGVECKNYSVCGISNEGIFHNVVNTLARYKSQEITLVIVGWTSTMREYWRAEDREWFIIPSWCATAKQGQSFTHFKDYTDSNINLHPRICSDRAEYLDPLSTIYDTVIRYKFDGEEYESKKSNYVDMIRVLCEHQGVRLIESCCMGSVGSININMDNFGTWRQGLGHPTKTDHEQIAQQILLTL
jgi:hypothetical protein